MVNDTTTLNGALSELGETMAANLTTQGVSSTASEGLTTLAGKILDIQGGGGGGSITLSTNKSILSYYDSESATLTATYETGATMELYNANTMTKIGNFTETTSGTYTYTYSATGVGDVNLVAKAGSDMSSPVQIEDCYLYAPTEISRTSTHNSEILTSMFNDFDFTSDSFVCELDIKFPHDATAFAIAPSGRTTTYHHMSMGVSWYSNTNTLSLYLGRQSSGEDSYRYNEITLNTYYTLKIVYENDTVTTYLDGTQKGEYANKSYFNGETREIYWFEWASGYTTYVKNVKIKEIGSSTPYNPCATYIAEIDSAIEYINGSGN